MQIRSSNHKVRHQPPDESDVNVAADVDLISPTDPDERRRLDTLTARRALAREAERGIEAARLEDPDIDAKDGDLAMLKV